MKDEIDMMQKWIKIIILFVVLLQSIVVFSQEYTLPAFIDDITSCDIDLDGDVDILCICQVLNYDEDSIFIFYNNGEGAFQRIGYHYPNVNFVLCGCVNEDSFPDIVSRFNSNIYYIPNLGQNLFGETIPIVEMSGTLEVSNITDVDLDNWNDLIYNNTSYEYWGVFKNNGDLTFTNEIIQTGSSTTNPGVGFITDDSLPDIVLTYSAFDRSSVNVNNDNFNFAEVILEETFIGQPFVMNIDNQGTDDFAFANYYTKTVPLYKFIGNDQFELQSNFYAEGTYPLSSFLPADFNQDGFDDFAITRGDWWNSSDSMYFYLNDQNWSFYLNQTLYTGELNWFKSHAVDLNGDSYPDIFMKNYNGSNILVLLWNDGNGNFSFENPVAINEIPKQSSISISASPNPFSEQVRILVNAEDFADLKFKVYDINGRKVKGLQLSGWSPFFTWDGRDESGHTCPAGLYLIVVEQHDYRSYAKVVKR